MQYAVANGTVRWARPETTLTTRPREARSAGSAAAVTRHGPEQVDVDHGERVRVGRLARALRDADAGVVDQHVEPAEPRDRLRDRRVDRGLVADVAGEHARAVGGQVEPERRARRAPAAPRRRRAADPAARRR